MLCEINDAKRKAPLDPLAQNICSVFVLDFRKIVLARATLEKISEDHQLKKIKRILENHERKNMR